MGSDLEFLSPSRNCIICKDPRTPQLEQQYVHKKINAAEVVDVLNAEPRLGVSRSAWYTHIKFHLKPDVAAALSSNATQLANEVVDKISELVQQLDITRDIIESFRKTVDVNTDPLKLRTYIQLLAEHRHTIETLAKLQGEFSDSALIKITNIRQENYNIQEVVMESLCTACKLKVAARLGKDESGGIKVESRT